MLGCASVTVAWCYTRDKANGPHFCCSNHNGFKFFVVRFFVTFEVTYLLTITEDGRYFRGLCTGKKLRVTLHCLLRTFNNIWRADTTTVLFNHLPEFKSNGVALFTRLEKINAVHIHVNLNHTILHYFRRWVGHTVRMREMRM